MANHYFDENPEQRSDERTVTAHLRGQQMSFRSDHGVFSKREVDYGTRVLLDVYRLPDVEGDILDMGCGYGPIGLTLAAETNRTIWMADVNERALELAGRNAEEGGLFNTRVMKSNLFDELGGKTFASVLANPPVRAGKETVHTLFEEAYQHLCSGGSFWTVLQKKQGAPSAGEKLEAVFDSVHIEARKKGYYIFYAKKN
ncbi:class I SAM-dependent methyltransferase [Salibacterium halotolerans]|uniref:16S rRNA (Guanine1207-N2)-methyltransferase n=1 Tax=Salibacterium halotolerans TaxID=1884432 RepID=A0A1I5WE73_9BACI|nr:methyltransferase [Salibacterium halotolerans]SFQ17897.1 16S rRNA (guanine1207-N2)-methyltransferase [Salibacterium halotolerans]